jgi:NAD(P)-dependent dehydrogenase (short-subunit alcohol dehydrogenase family)
LPGLGAFCAGMDLQSAGIVRDITAATLASKARISRFGRYQSPGEIDLFRMEYDAFQRAKVENLPCHPLTGRVALVTGAAGAIGMGVSEGLLAQGCAVALADLPGERLDAVFDELRCRYGDLVMAVPFDVTEPNDVARGFADTIAAWGGIDIVIANAGVALVSDLTSLTLEQFRGLERVNVEGTLNLLSEAGRHFRSQACGGDIILISTKNVFAPGAKFGAYSATKAAAHQLARIASLEMAEIGVRVNMVAPDGVFSHGNRRSGLWAAVGPDRMRARGLDEAGLEEYYRNRNLLKARITATHVANAVLYFATRQTPTTGATIPVDGGLPDATPR